MWRTASLLSTFIMVVLVTGGAESQDPPASIPNPTVLPSVSDDALDGTRPVLCDTSGNEQVLHGDDGSVVTHNATNIKCRWRGKLSTGKHPVFHFQFIEGSCGSCRCDMTVVSEVYDGVEHYLGKICEPGDQLNAASSNEFVIEAFGFASRRTIQVFYKAE